MGVLLAVRPVKIRGSAGIDLLLKPMSGLDDNLGLSEGAFVCVVSGMFL